MQEETVSEGLGNSPRVTQATGTKQELELVQYT